MGISSCLISGTYPLWCHLIKNAYLLYQKEILLYSFSKTSSYLKELGPPSSFGGPFFFISIFIDYMAEELTTGYDPKWDKRVVLIEE